MYSFANDYSEGACPEVLEALISTNYKQTEGYGLDIYCQSASESIKEIIGRDDIDVHFVTGGTPANVLAMCLLKPYEAVIAVDTGHINVHETGAVEATGHKIIQVKGSQGKITVEDIENVVKAHVDEHMVKPRMVFISNASEFGTIYYKEELKQLYETCKDLGLYLYMDGARLANALVAQGNDLSLRDICDYTDLFYLGATKNGALLGEAMIIKNNNLKPNFRYLMKQHCSMLAKARIVGIQFLALLENDLYLENARNANIMAQALKYIFKQLGFKFYVESPTNQIFPIIDNGILDRIKTRYDVIEWGKYDDDHTIVRFVCSWATRKSDIQEFYEDLLMFVRQERTR